VAERIQLSGFGLNGRCCFSWRFIILCDFKNGLLVSYSLSSIYFAYTFLNNYYLQSQQDVTPSLILALFNILTVTFPILAAKIKLNLPLEVF